MIEKKFKLANPDSSFLDMNCGIKYGDRLLNFKQLIDLLNELQEENEELKQKNHELEKFRYSVFKNIEKVTKNDI